MSRTRVALLSSVLALGVAAAVAPLALAALDFPVPSSYPISWELTFKHGTPKRIVVDVPGSLVPKSYWYMTYTVTNDTKKEQSFFPSFDLLTQDGNVHPADKNVPPRVFDQVKAAERNQFLEDFTKLSGPVRIGEAEAKDGVAIWPETVTPAGHFSVFATGLSGEAVTMKMVDGKYQKVDQAADLKQIKDLIILRKTLQLNYFIRGQESYENPTEVVADGEEWIMR